MSDTEAKPDAPAQEEETATEKEKEAAKEDEKEQVGFCFLSHCSD
jgi:hypothetical protein